MYCTPLKILLLIKLDLHLGEKKIGRYGYKIKFFLIQMLKKLRMGPSMSPTMVTDVKILSERGHMYQLSTVHLR